MGGRRGSSDDPERIDRFVVKGRLGVGGMSVVYEALDERVGRRVALKLMLVGDAETDRDRLRREAQALARVSHPNVVEVFEIGEHEGKAFVAMELIEGESLDRWLRVEPRSSTAIVEAFLQAGEGLAAAHAHGLVHRDFKPGNVLMSNDGRVRVVDFGLVRESGGAESSDALESLRSGGSLRGSGSGSESSAGSGSGAGSEPGSLPPSLLRMSQLRVSAWNRSLTRTGAMVGTPAFMSPEQFAGIEVGPASDQFSFCVALYEALWGRHPFVVDGNWKKLPYNVLDGRLHPPPVVRGIPKALAKLVLRGLAQRPGQRWPSMDALLQALRKVLARRGPRPWSVVLGTMAVLVAVPVLHCSMLTQEEHHCDRGAYIMKRAWRTGLRDDLRGAWQATGLPGAEETWSRVDSRLQAKVDDWWGIHNLACEGEVVANRSATCLMRWAERMRAQLRVMEHPSETMLHNAVQMVSELSPLEECSTALDVPVDEPAPEVPPWQQALDEIDAIVESGQLEEAAPLIDALLARATDEGDQRLAAEASQRLGRVLIFRMETAKAAEVLESTYLEAKLQGLDRLAAATSLLLLYLHGEVSFQDDEAWRWAGHAEAEVDRLGDDALRAQYYNAWGRALRSNEKFEDALAQHEAALALLQQLTDPEPYDVANSHFQIGTTLGLLNESEKARVHLEDALRIQREALGEHHPRIVLTLINIAIFTRMSGHAREAEALLDDAYARSERVNPRFVMQRAFIENHRAELYEEEGRRHDAAAAFEHYIELYTTATPDDERYEGLLAFQRCKIARMRGEQEQALEHCGKALERHDPEVPQVLKIETEAIVDEIGSVLADLGRRDESLARHREAFDHRMKWVEDQPESSDPLRLQRGRNAAWSAMGRAYSRLGRDEEALAMLEQASKGYAKASSGPAAWQTWVVELDVANALLALGRSEAARERLRVAAVELEAHMGPDALWAQRGLVALAEAELATGDVARARAIAERALRLLEARPESVDEEEGRARFVLARCLTATGTDGARAIELAQRAEVQWTSAGEQIYQRELELVRGWLADHRGHTTSPRRPS